MRFLTLIFLLLTAQNLLAQDFARKRVDASPRHHEWISIKYGDRTVQAFVVYPEVKEKKPVVLVIHTIAGFIPWIESISDQLAEAGYIAVAPDLLSGMGPNGGRSDSFTTPAEANAAVGRCKAGSAQVEFMWAQHTAPSQVEVQAMRNQMRECLATRGATIPESPSDLQLRATRDSGAVSKADYQACQFAAADAFEIDEVPG